MCYLFTLRFLNGVKSKQLIEVFIHEKIHWFFFFKHLTEGVELVEKLHLQFSCFSLQFNRAAILIVLPSYVSLCGFNFKRVTYPRLQLHFIHRKSHLRLRNDTKFARMMGKFDRLESFPVVLDDPCWRVNLYRKCKWQQLLNEKLQGESLDRTNRMRAQQMSVSKMPAFSFIYWVFIFTIHGYFEMQRADPPGYKLTPK